MEQLNSLLAFSYLAAALMSLAAPFVLAVFLARRYGARWRHWFYGVLVFLLFQALTRIPAMVYLQSLPSVKEALEQPAVAWSFLLVAALTAGLFEEGGRWLAFRFVLPRKEHTWTTATMLGAGHGGLEAIGVGLVQAAALVGYVVVVALPAERLGTHAAQIEEARKQFAQLQGWEPLLGGWERLCALAIQVALTVMVLQALLRGARWWWYALAAHAAVDFTSVGLLRVGATAWGHAPAMLAVEGLVTVYALVALWYVRTSMRNHAAHPLARADQPSPDAQPAGTG